MDNFMTHVTLDVQNTSITFAPTLKAYNDYINKLGMNDKVAPTINYLKRIVVPESKVDLDTLILLPGAALSLVAVINDEFAPDLEITVKK